MEKYSRQVNKCLKRLASGKSSEKDFDALYNLTANHLRMGARRYLIDKRSDWAAVSEAYTRALGRMGTFDGEKDGYNWLCKITKNVVMDFNARVRKEKEQNVSLEAVGNLSDSAAVDAETKMDLEDALNSLDEENRDIVYLRFFENVTLEEIGKKYGVGKAAIKRRLDRILEKMKKFLE